MQRGTVKWFSSEKGYGFIKPQSGGDDVFVHQSNLSGMSWNEGLREGDTVEFETERTDKGLSAINVSRVEENTSGVV
jgi:CspA family cold shock protein